MKVFSLHDLGWPSLRGKVLPAFSFSSYLCLIMTNLCIWPREDPRASYTSEQVALIRNYPLRRMQSSCYGEKYLEEGRGVLRLKLNTKVSYMAETRQMQEHTWKFIPNDLPNIWENQEAPQDPYFEGFPIHQQKPICRHHFHQKDLAMYAMHNHSHHDYLSLPSWLMIQLWLHPWSSSDHRPRAIPITMRLSS